MKFVRMTWENFGPFRKRQVLPLADQGLVLVRGRNLVSASADDNGSGKTTLFSMLSWVLFGEGLPGQDGKIARGDDVACRFTKGPCIVQLDTEDDDGQWQIERCRRPTKLAFDGAGQYWTGDDADQKIAQRIGFGALTFRNALVLSQGTVDRLATADQAVYLKMLDEIQGIDFRQPAERAVGWRNEWRNTLQQLEEDFRENTTIRYQAQKQIAELEQAHDAFKDEKDARIKTQDEAVENAKQNLLTAERQLLDARKLSGKAAAAREAWEFIKTLQADQQEKANVHQTNVREYQRVKDKYMEFRRDLNNLLHSKLCPTCRRAIASEAQVNEVEKLFAADEREKKQQVTKANKNLEISQHALDQAETVLQRNRTLAKDLNERTVSELEAQCTADRLLELEDQVKKVKLYLVNMQNQLRDERHAKWSGQSALDLARKQALDATAMITTTETEIARVKRTLLAADYWVEAFGDRGLRSMLFDSVSDFLNERLAHHLRILASGEADVAISAFKTLKKGTTKEQMTMTAQWHWGAATYGAGSAGQGGRVNLALVAAHQDLAERRSARPFPLRVFDEPESHCDPRGQEIIAEWIMQEASRRNTTFVVTHNPILADLLQPDHVATVVLDRDGARIEYE